MRLWISYTILVIPTFLNILYIFCIFWYTHHSFTIRVPIWICQCASIDHGKLMWCYVFLQYFFPVGCRRIKCRKIKIFFEDLALSLYNRDCISFLLHSKNENIKCSRPTANDNNLSPSFFTQEWLDQVVGNRKDFRSYKK